MFNLIEKLKKVKEFRQDKGRRHPLWLVLTVVILGLMSGNVGYRQIGYFVKANRENLIKYLNIATDRLPSYSTIRRVMMGVDWANLIEIFNEWASENYSEKTKRDWLAVDGKSLRSTVTNFGDEQQNFVAIVSLFSHSTGWVVRLGRFENKKESEIGQARDMVKDCALTNKVFTGDALHCNEATVREIIDSKNHYLIAVKKNQHKLYEKVESLAEIAEPKSINITNDISHGRKITRQVSVYTPQTLLHKKWEHLQSFIKVERSGSRGKKAYQETMYYVSSIKQDAQIFAEKIRGHWQIENRLHWVKDVIFNEDRERITEPQAATNFSTLITIVLNLFRILGFWSITEGQRWLAHRWYKLFVLAEFSGVTN
jgi:predicted transposase YbfD/YdcC